MSKIWVGERRSDEPFIIHVPKRILELSNTAPIKCILHGGLTELGPLLAYGVTCDLFCNVSCISNNFLGHSWVFSDDVRFFFRLISTRRKKRRSKLRAWRKSNHFV